MFENHVDPSALRTLDIQKRLFNESNELLTYEDDQTTFSYRLYLSNGSDDTLRLANMYKYYVRNPAGKLCRWDVDGQKFVPTNYSDITSVTQAEKRSVTFETSMNGAISKIPAGYTVSVPALLVGTRFKVEERSWEIPLGYRFIAYDWDENTYTLEGDDKNIGWVRASQSPKMHVDNKRGWELSVNKVWNDDDYASSHAPVYVALYIGDTLVEGSVRQITGSDAVRYYFDSLEQGRRLDDYVAREVELTNPVLSPGTDVVSAYGSITPVGQGESVQVSATPKGTDTSKEFSYTVSYRQGTSLQTAEGADGHGNVRTDYITNSRSDGVVITLYDMKKPTVPLQYGKFTLKQGNKELGRFTSDENGRVTVMFDCVRGAEYTLTETAAPDTYIGVPNPIVFSVAENNTVSVDGNAEKWAKGRSASKSAANVIAYVDVYNMPFTLVVTKYSARTNAPVEGAEFALYRGYKGVGGQVKDSAPMDGYENLVSDEHGIIPGIDNTLAPGTYYLTETNPPRGHTGFDKDIIFTVSSLSTVELRDPDDQIRLISTGEIENNNDVEKAYEIRLTNPFDYTPAELTVSKTVEGTFGDKNREFTFTLSVEEADASESYAWSKNGEPQSDRLHSGDTFTLKNGENVTIALPKNVNITVAEDNAGYETSFKLGTEDAVEGNTTVLMLRNNQTLAVTNTKNSVLPTGVTTHILLPLLLLLSGIAGTAFVFMRRKEPDPYPFLNKIRQSLVNRKAE